MLGTLPNSGAKICAQTLDVAKCGWLNISLLCNRFSASHAHSKQHLQLALAYLDRFAVMWPRYMRAGVDSLFGM